MDSCDLLDLVIEDCTTITLFDVKTGEEIMRGVSVEEAKTFVSRGNFELCSIEINNGTLCLNIEEEQD